MGLINTDYDPVFMMGEGSYRKVQLTNDAVEAELIQVSNMMCGHLHLTSCGSGGCFSEIIFDGLVYNIRGRPFLLLPEPSYESLGDNNKMTAIIAWWGYGGSCHTQEDEETDPLHTLKPSSCLLTASTTRGLVGWYFSMITGFGLKGEKPSFIMALLNRLVPVSEPTRL